MAPLFLILRRSDDAKADQQPMHAMVRGVSVKQDGVSFAAKL